MPSAACRQPPAAFGEASVSLRLSVATPNLSTVFPVIQQRPLSHPLSIVHPADSSPLRTPVVTDTSASAKLLTFNQPSHNVPIGSKGFNGAFWKKPSENGRS